MRIVHNRSIPNVDNERLRDSLDQIHAQIHTPDGIREWNETRRAMVNMGVKGRLIAAELYRRGEPAPECAFCCPRLDELPYRPLAG